MTDNPYRDEIAGYLRRADCHFGHTLREVEDGLTVDEASVKRDVGRDQVASCRRAVNRVLDGTFSANETQASYDEAVFRALLHFRGEMSDGLSRYVLAQLARFKSDYFADLKPEPLRCPYATGAPAKAGSSGRPEPPVCPDCRMAHAGECW
ncbi:Uncharacterised protein [Mycobacteroides abscessus subsp. abscessus]|uniref:hypothetical protein n=1 Tax=Mycobacteroides abscessus TaxID=36809 RepID=UPI00092B314F|nr:hypothetical protein [Mycobacteroides abscessus]MBE5513767.1 hypothetical protein [Mycobacteroides abscessus]MBN7327686.1 hypothetical protein [Mycobacteroides abscessus subsp. abscessus]SID61977.1 Uncharacterised protein [Mycobacteroides abscessus subsp. abscessus]SIE83671.1 Uncharacterised protein [Mycobacteroides abscessus subsp. abscessus]SIF72271.1 Uncharacterised protein [Mycobacteroides abscessus subsp. abscessus]